MPKASFNPDDFKVGGGLYEGPIKVTNPRFEKNDFKGKADKTTCLVFDGEYQDQDGNIVTNDFIFGLGKGWEPSDDSETPSDNTTTDFYCHEKLTAPSSGSTYAIFVTSLKNAKNGFLIDGDKGAMDLDGRYLQVARKESPTPQKKDRVVYVVEAVLSSVPWERKAATVGARR